MYRNCFVSVDWNRGGFYLILFFKIFCLWCEIELGLCFRKLYRDWFFRGFFAFSSHENISTHELFNEYTITQAFICKYMYEIWCLFFFHLTNILTFTAQHFDNFLSQKCFSLIVYTNELKWCCVRSLQFLFFCHFVSLLITLVNMDWTTGYYIITFNMTNNEILL